MSAYFAGDASEDARTLFLEVADARTFVLQVPF